MQQQIWAAITPQSALVRERASQTEETVTHRIIARQPLEVQSGWSLRKGTRRFEILTIFDPDETGRYWQLDVREEGR
jgi:SPP1 family predicted phage head-tail adaptor